MSLVRLYTNLPLKSNLVLQNLDLVSQILDSINALGRPLEPSRLGIGLGKNILYLLRVIGISRGFPKEFLESNIQNTKSKFYNTKLDFKGRLVNSLTKDIDTLMQL